MTVWVNERRMTKTKSGGAAVTASPALTAEVKHRRAGSSRPHAVGYPTGKSSTLSEDA